MGGGGGEPTSFVDLITQAHFPQKLPSVKQELYQNKHIQSALLNNTKEGVYSQNVELHLSSDESILLVDQTEPLLHQLLFKTLILP